MADATGYANGGMSNNQGPRRAALVGNPVYPVGPDGRTGHSAYRVIGGGLLNLAKKYGPNMQTIPNFFKNVRPTFLGGTKNMPDAPTVGNFTSFGGAYDKIKNFVLPSTRFRQPITPKGYNVGYRGQRKPIGSTYEAAPLTRKEMLADMSGTFGRAVRANPGYAVLGAGQIKNLGDYAGVAKDLVVGAGQGTTNYLLGTEFGKEKPPVLKKAAPGDRGSLLKTESAPKELTTAEKETKDKERLSKIYKLLGVDKAQRNAASKALVDVSRYIDEGGKDTVSKKNIGSTISKAISSFDKRLDKADQLKEAAGVMMAKSYLEGGDKAQEREYRQVMIDAKKKEMNPDFKDLVAVYNKSNMSDPVGAAADKKFGSGYGGPLMSTKDFNKQLKAFEGQQLEEDNILEIATNAVKNLEMASEEGKKVPNGYYKVGENIVLITDGEAKSIVG